MLFPCLEWPPSNHPFLHTANYSPFRSQLRDHPAQHSFPEPSSRWVGSLPSQTYVVPYEYIHNSICHSILIPPFCLILTPWILLLTCPSHLVNHGAQEISPLLVFLDQSLPLYSCDHYTGSLSTSCSRLLRGPSASNLHTPAPSSPLWPGEMPYKAQSSLVSLLPLASSLDRWLLCAIGLGSGAPAMLNYKLFQPRPTLSHSSQQTVSRFCTSVYMLLFMCTWNALSPSLTTPVQLSFFFLIEIQLIYNIILISGIQHNDSGLFTDYTPLKVTTRQWL